MEAGEAVERNTSGVGGVRTSLQATRTRSLAQVESMKKRGRHASEVRWCYACRQDKRTTTSTVCRPRRLSARFTLVAIDVGEGRQRSSALRRTRRQ